MCNKRCNMYKRLKPGEFIAMTPEQKQEHKRMLNRRYRVKNPDKIHKRNLYFYELYKTIKPCVCICKKCGNKFNAPRKYYKLCDTCRNTDWGKIRTQNILDRRNERIRKHELIIQLAKLGLKQSDIAAQVGYCQRNVSKIMVDAGMRQIKEHTRVNKKC